jgi:trimeric autotransporter adhesin
MKKLISCLFILFITKTIFAQPGNDNVGSATVLIPTVACELNVSLRVNQTIALSTFVSAANSGTCTNANARDVWYKFVANDTTHNIILNNLGTSWGGSQRIQLLTNSVPSNGSGTWTNVACSNAGSLTATTAVGTTYFIRIHRNNTVANTGTNWGFDICLSKSVVSASRMKEVFSSRVLSGASVMNNPWEVTYGPDGKLWVTESKGYKVYRIDPITGAKVTVLDISQFSTTAPDNSYRCQFNNGAGAQGGLAGLALHPNFMDGTVNEKNWVYLAYVYSQQSTNFFTNRLVRFYFDEGTERLITPELLCDSLPGSNDHNSQRMIIAPEVVSGPSFLFYASGDMGAGQGTNPNRPIRSQLPDSYEGKILRFNLDQDTDPVQMPTTMNYNRWIPNDNPYNTILGVQSAVWNIGMRNNQGFAYDAASHILYGTSHGAYSDDEINILQRFKNYGHPLVLGFVDGNYDGTTTPSTSTSYSAGSPFASAVSGNSTCPPIGSEVTRRNEINLMGYGDYTDPLFSAYVGPTSGTTSVKYIWSNNPTPSNSLWPSEGLSGLDLYTNKLIPGWKQSLIASGLKWGRLLRLKLGATGTTTMPSNLANSNNTGDTVLYFQSGNRYRDIAFDPNGKDIYVIMDNGASSVATDGNPPVTPACAGCLIKYSFLGYAPDAAGLSSIPKSIDVTAPLANNTCTAGTTVTIDAANNNLWVPITGPDGNIMAEINANGNNLGTVTSSFYKKSGGIRVAGGVHYLDRNITITPQFQPTLPAGSPLVKIRLYLSKAEYDALDADGLSGISAITDLKILKNGDACGAAIASNTTLVTPANTLLADLQHGANGYVLQGNIAGFSSFYFASANITLPLQLIYFTGTLKNNATLLNWETENEKNVSSFVVERGIDGRNFSGIGSVAAIGNTTSRSQYAYIDYDVTKLSSPVVYYRLRMVDIDGAFTYSQVVAISLADITGRVSVFPNPASQKVTVSINAPVSGKVNWKLTDNTGRIVLQNTDMLRQGNNNLQIDVNRLTGGVYYLSISGAGIDQKVKLQKL